MHAHDGEFLQFYV